MSTTATAPIEGLTADAATQNPQVEARVWLDGYREIFDATFDATPTMFTLTIEEAEYLREMQWRECEGADLFAMNAAETDSQVAEVFTAMEVLHKASPRLGGDAPGFEVAIDAEQAEAWITHHRPTTSSWPTA